MIVNWQEYVADDFYHYGLSATKTVWSSERIFSLSGLYVHLNLFPIVEIMEIISANSIRYDSTENMLKTLRTVSNFLHAVVGLPKNNDLEGGIKNIAVIDWLEERKAFHDGIHAIRPWMMSYVAKIITDAPIRLLGVGAYSTEQIMYYRNYMANAWDVMGIELKSDVKNDNGARVETTATSSPYLSTRIKMLKEGYSMLYGTQAALIMFRQVTAVLPLSVINAIEGSDDANTD